MSFYREVMVLKQLSDKGAVRFICYEDVSTGQFCVDTAETFQAPAGAASEAWFNQQRLERFISEGADLGVWFPTLKEALEDWPDEAIPPLPG